MEERLINIENKLDSQAEIIESIRKTLELIAVQKVQIATIRKDVQELEEKYDSVTGPEGILTKMQVFQGACPKDSINTQMRWLWCVVVPQSLVLIGLFIALLGKGFL